MFRDVSIGQNPLICQILLFRDVSIGQNQSIGRILMFRDIFLGQNPVIGQIRMFRDVFIDANPLIGQMLTFRDVFTGQNPMFHIFYPPVYTVLILFSRIYTYNTCVVFLFFVQSLLSFSKNTPNRTFLQTSWASWTRPERWATRALPS